MGQAGPGHEVSVGSGVRKKPLTAIGEQTVGRDSLNLHEEREMVNGVDRQHSS
jgi:hypothetical protein